MHPRTTTNGTLTVRPREAAKLLGLSASVLYELLNAGELASFRVGRSRLIPRSEVDRWLADKVDAAKGLAS